MKIFSQSRSFIGLVLITIITYTASCNRTSQDIIKPSIELSNDSLSIYMDFIRNSGFNKEELTYDQEKKIFIIGGDVHTSLNDVRIRYKLSFGQKGARPNQWRWANIVNQNVVKHIKIYIASNVPSNWVGGINSAIEYWNNVPETQVQFKLTSNSSEAQIQISTYQDVATTIAAAQLPQSTGQPGSYININTAGNQYNSGNTNFLKLAIAHEMGHTIGLMHTDYNYNVASDPNANANATFIPGTSQPGQDRYSLMHHAVDDQLDFSSSDYIAVRYLYPFQWSSLLDKPRGYQSEVGMINVTWDSSVDNSTVKIELYDEDNVFITQLASSAPNTGSFTAYNPSINVGFYRVKLTFNSNSTHTDMSDDLFYYSNN